MRYNRCLIALLLCAVINEGTLCGQSIASFVKEFKNQFEKKRELYSDDKLIYAPRLKNLYENEGWWALTPIQRRDSLFVFLTPPILANDIAFDIHSGEYYRFPLGQLCYKEDSRGDEICGPIINYGWFYFDVIVPLINYLNNNNVQYIFTIENFCNDKYYGWYWTIEGETLYALIYDKNVGEVHKQKADIFLNNPENFYLFLDPLTF